MPEIAADSNVECVICLDKNNQPFYRLSCGHGSPAHDPMHKACLKQAFRSEVDSGAVAGFAYVRCPICRQNPAIQDIENIMA
jgi:hypothetical protein